MERPDFLRGIRDALPAVPPNVPFGMLFGATAVEVGFAPLEATAMSLFMFAGAAQLAAVDLLRADTALPIVFVTVLIINLRYAVYSASIVPLVRHLPVRWRAVMGYAMFDINYALLANKFQLSDGQGGEGGDADGIHRGWYYLGTTLPLVGTFVVTTYAGALVGTVLAGGLSLEFAIPLIFISLLAPSIEGSATVATAVVATVVAVVASGLPFNVGLLVAIVCGVVAGGAVDNRERLRGRTGVS